MKEKKDDWFRPWVVRPELLKAQQERQALRKQLTPPTPKSNKVSSCDHSSSCGSEAKLTHSASDGSVSKLITNTSKLSSSSSSFKLATSPLAWRSPPLKRSPLGASLTSLLLGKFGRVHEGLWRCYSGGSPHSECHSAPTPKEEALLLHLKSLSSDGAKSSQKPTAAPDGFSAASEDASKGSPGCLAVPGQDYGASPLRQCGSLENVSRGQVTDDFLGNGLSLCQNPQNSSPVANATSLPHIYRLSDCEGEDQPPDGAAAERILESKRNQEDKEAHKPTPAKRAEKGGTKKTNLRRRRAYYRTPKDGRSKSLTHIDTLAGGETSNEMIVPGGMEAEGKGELGPSDKLGVPDDPTVRRRKFSLRQKVLSSEYFLVTVDSCNDPVEEFIPSSRGTSLRDALEKRGIDLSGLHVYVEGSRSPLSLATDSYVLGGKVLRISRSRDDSRSPVRSRSSGSAGCHSTRKPSTGLLRTGQSRLLWGSSADETSSVPASGSDGLGSAGGSQEGSLKGGKTPKSNNNRWSLFPNASKEAKMDSLIQQLDTYSRYGITKPSNLLPFQLSDAREEFALESSWKDIVECSEQLSERQEQQQSAIWELVKTEATYLQMLKVITDLFLACLYSLQNDGLLNEIDTDRLFSNVQEIYSANLSFWQDHLSAMLDEARKARSTLDPSILSEGFLMFEEIFRPYTHYCLEQTNCQLYCKEKDHDNDYFKMYLAWCETQKECNRLRLVDILVQPMQRLTKYSLLLKAILKKTDEEDHCALLTDMVNRVERFVSNVNSALRQRHEEERLREIAKRIEVYDVVEAKEDELEKAVKSYSDLNLACPMPGCPEHIPRQLLHQGDFKFRDVHTSKMDVHVFLFTDLLLITKVTQRKAERVKVVRPPYLVARLVPVDVKDSTTLGLVYLSEWGVAAAAFTLQSSDTRGHKGMQDALKRAKDLYKEAQSREALVFDQDEEPCFGVHLLPRSPRPSSSRTSRVSSLVHSHSGSVDLNETSFVSPSGPHPPSVDLCDVRASSASSEDSMNIATPEIQRSKSLECQQPSGTSPRIERLPGKTPNTLCVTTPYATGQSLPDLNVESANSLAVPSHKALSPCRRGITYPPPSPRTLRRSAPVPQSRNPPLIKSRHVTSAIGPTQVLQEVSLNHECDSLRLEEAGESEDDSVKAGQRRVSRNERLDNRRYHTAGAIDDIKKQDTKDASIHKRLSWNYGQGPPSVSHELGSETTQLGHHKVSCESVHSSSGVSSTSSLHRSVGSEGDALENIDDNEFEVEEEGTVVDLLIKDCTSLRISPHISTTYICHDSDVTLGVCSQYIMHSSITSSENGKDSSSPSSGVKIDVSETNPGVSSVQITVTDGPATHSRLSSNQKEKPKGNNVVRMREILLNDANIEASDV